MILSPVTDGDVLGLPEPAVKWMKDFIKGELVFYEVEDVRKSYLNIVSTLSNSKIMSNPVSRKLANTMIKNASDSYAHYWEVLSGK